MATLVSRVKVSFLTPSGRTNFSAREGWFMATVLRSCAGASGDENPAVFGFLKAERARDLPGHNNLAHALRCVYHPLRGARTWRRPSRAHPSDVPRMRERRRPGREGLTRQGRRKARRALGVQAKASGRPDSRREGRRGWQGKQRGFHAAEGSKESSDELSGRDGVGERGGMPRRRQPGRQRTRRGRCCRRCRSRRAVETPGRRRRQAVAGTQGHDQQDGVRRAHRAGAVPHGIRRRRRVASRADGSVASNRSRRGV